LPTIYKICPASAWREAERQGVFRGSADDIRDGYIHFSTAAQVAETARKHFFGQTGLFLIAYAAFVGWLGTRQAMMKSMVLLVIIGNAAWTLASIALLFSGVVSPNLLGELVDHPWPGRSTESTV
jgi:hypothetical protein